METRGDEGSAQPWRRIVDTYDSAGRLDRRWGEYDKTSKHHYAWFIDWDQGDKYDWASKSVYVGNTRNAVFDYTVIVNDDKSKVVIDYDTAPTKTNWSVKTTYYNASRALDRQTGTFDDGRSWLVDWDDRGSLPWKSYRDTYDELGRVTTTIFTNDDGTVTTVDWALVSRQQGTPDRDVLTGTGDRDLLQGFSGNDTLIGGAGADRLEGAFGNDVYYVDTLQDLVVELPNRGIDTVRSAGSHVLAPNVENLVLLSGTYGTGNAEKNYMVGNDDRNVLSGEAGADQLSGLKGNDVLSGGTGNDTLEGGPGADILTGGAGADAFLWRNMSDTGLFGSTADLVRDFSPSGGDRLHLRLIDANTNMPGNQSFTFIGNAAFSAAGQIRSIHTDGETRLLLNTDSDAAVEGVIRLSGLKTPDASWFVL